MYSRLAEKAALAALKCRFERGVALNHPICVFDFAEQIGVDVWFRDMPTLEGIYVRESSPKIILTSPRHRSIGRLSYTCGHELGHHVFQHGTQFDLLEASYDSKDEKEKIADFFAGFLLMPKTTIEFAISIRRWGRLTEPLQVYSLSNWLGVGYETLLTHLRYTLNLISDVSFRDLKKTTVKSLKHQLLKKHTDSEVFLVDHHWHGRPIDIQVNDKVVFSNPVTIRNQTNRADLDKGQRVLTGLSQGILQVHDEKNDWFAHVRISRENYEGRNRFRFLAE